MTIAAINTNVQAGEDPDISIKTSPDGNIKDTVLERLNPYQTPHFPPGVNLGLSSNTHEEMDEVEDYMISNGPWISQEEKDILKDLNGDTMATIISGEGRECALISIDEQDLDAFEEHCNIREARHSLIASSPQTWDPQTSHDEIDCIIKYFNNGKMRKQQAHDDSELDQKNRIIIEATILNKGTKHDNATTRFGKVYIDKKFTRYVPEVGKKVRMVIGMKGCGKTHPWNCYKIL